MKVKYLATIIFSALFFIGMGVLTFTARGIHRASLPKVRAEKLPLKNFPWEYIDENGKPQTGMKTALAIETERLGGTFFALDKGYKNGELRDYAKQVTLQTGAEADGYTEIVGAYAVGQLITAVDGEMYDGCEVYVIE